MADSTTAASLNPRVLVADDEQVIGNTLAIILNQAGFEARAVFSGEKAIESLDSFQPDMLISDVIMTGMTGIEVAIITRSKLPKCKILLFSCPWARAFSSRSAVAAWPEKGRILRFGSVLRVMMAASRPGIPVMMASVMSMWGWKLSSDSTAFSPLKTARASKPAWLRMIARVLAMTCSSSATRTLGFDVVAVVE